MPLRAKTPRNRGQIGAPEDRTRIIQPIGAQFMDLGPVSPVIEDANHDLKPVARHRL